MTASPAVEEYGIHGADADLERTIEEVIGLYTDAGMELPLLNIHVHAGTEECNGAPGLFSKGGDHRRVDLCTPSRALVIHELAHAWEYHNVDDATRDAFMNETGAVAWNSHDVTHPARGVEQFAHAIEWGLKTQKIQAISMNYYEQDLGLFELATGMPSPRIQQFEDSDVQIVRPVVSNTNDPIFG